MTPYVDPTYVADNRRHAERLLILLASRRLLRDHHSDEDVGHCRESSQELRKALESQMLTLAEGGFLEQILSDLQRACTNFVSAAGRNSANFSKDKDLFRFQLDSLREVFAQRLRQVVDVFGLSPSAEIQEIMHFSA